MWIWICIKAKPLVSCNNNTMSSRRILKRYWIDANDLLVFLPSWICQTICSIVFFSVSKWPGSGPVTKHKTAEHSRASENHATYSTVYAGERDMSDQDRFEHDGADRSRTAPITLQNVRPLTTLISWPSIIITDDIKVHRFNDRSSLLTTLCTSWHHFTRSLPFCWQSVYYASLPHTQHHSLPLYHLCLWSLSLLYNLSCSQFIHLWVGNAEKN